MYDHACLNHSDLNELYEHSHLLDPESQERLSAIKYRIKTYPKRFDRPRQHYSEYAGLLGMADFPLGHRLSSCCIRNRGCRVWKFCPYCAWRVKMELLKKFLTKYPKHQWCSMTIAFEGFLSIEPGFGDNIALYWDACISAIQRMVSEGYFKGAVWSEEVHVQSFLTREVQPHVHVVFVADQVTMEHIELLKSYVREYRGNSYDPQQGCFIPDDGARVEFPVSTRTRQIGTRYHFANALSYLAKPNDLHEAYKRDFESASRNGRMKVATLNQDVSEVLAGIGIAAYKRRQIDYKGNLDARSRTRFVGVKKAERARKSHYTTIQTILAVENLEHGVLDNPDAPENYGFSIEEVHEEQNRDITD